MSKAVEDEEVGPPTRADLVRMRDRVRSARKRAVRALTLKQRVSRRELEAGRAAFPPEEFAHIERPKTRGECARDERPCPFVSCVHHLYLDVSARTGSIKVNFPDVPADELEQLSETCALDVADDGGATLERIAEAMNITRERARQLEVTALAKVVPIARYLGLEVWRLR